MIFSYIYEKLNDLWLGAMKQKVVLAGPFSFTAILRMIKQANHNFVMQSNIHTVIGLIGRFREEYTKYSADVDKLGEQIESTAKQFNTVSTVRDRQLNRIIDKIDSQRLLEE